MIDDYLLTDRLSATGANYGYVYSAAGSSVQIEVQKLLLAQYDLAETVVEGPCKNTSLLRPKLAGLLKKLNAGDVVVVKDIERLGRRDLLDVKRAFIHNGAKILVPGAKPIARGPDSIDLDLPQ